LEGDAPTLATAKWAFPLAGLAVGGSLAGVYIAMNNLGLPAGLAAILALVAGVMMTGGLHEDGLADCADGFGGGQDRGQKLAIMKDSRVGSYGALALIFVIAARIMALAALPATAQSLILLISLAMVSRLTMVVYLSWLPSARAEGLGHQAGKDGGLSIVVATSLCAPVILLSGGFILFSLAALCSAAVLFGWTANRQIGGQTGDVCGAVQILSETAGWLCLAVLFTP
jgi:adenosylcobinamide-GDP ribazoletransferase